MSNATIRDAAVIDLNAAITKLAGIGGVTPPVGTFGTGLPARLAATTGIVRNCSTLAQLKAAIALGGDIRIPAGTTIDVRGESASTLYLTVAGSAGSPNQISGGKILGRVTINSNYWRIKGVEIANSVYDGIKIADGANAAFIDIDNCWIHDVGNMGIQVGYNTSSDIQVWNCLIETVGQAYPVTSWLMHSIYINGPTARWTICNNLFRPRNGFGVHMYPHPATIICSGNTTIGGLTRGGYLINGATSAKVVGDIIVGSPSGAFEITNSTAAQVTVQDCLQWNNVQGQWASGYAAAGTVANYQNLNPLLTADGHLGAGSPAIGYVQAARYSLLPAVDRAGKVRITADAGCYAA